VASLAVAAAPLNDAFSRSEVLPARATVVAEGSNEGATREIGEPNHASSIGGKSVWWSWTAPKNGNVTITTVGSTFDTLVAAYTGSEVSNLVLIAENDQDPNGGTTSALAFDAIGQT